METHKKVVYLMKNIREGLLGFMMYKTHLGVSKYISEYSLYEPITYLAQHLGFTVRNEVPVPNTNAHIKGDKPRIDFVFQYKNENKTLCIINEVKFYKKKSKSYNFDKDINKIFYYHKSLLKSKNVKSNASLFQFFGCLTIVAHNTSSFEKKLKDKTFENHLATLRFPCTSEDSDTMPKTGWQVTTLFFPLNS